MLWIVNVLFLIDCEQTRHPLWTQLSYWQMFMQNSEYLQLLSYLMQLQFTIDQMEFMKCFRFSRTTAEFGRSGRLKSAYHLVTIVSDEAMPE